MEDATSGKNSGAAQEELIAALVNLRDAFMTLSLALNDWQFESNKSLRTDAENAARQLVRKAASPRNSSF